MADPNATADARLARGAAPDAKAGPRWLVRPAPSPEAPDERDRKGAQGGMVLALAGGGLFWAAVGAAVWLMRR
jgi:hypothetical protein